MPFTKLLKSKKLLLLIKILISLLFLGFAFSNVNFTQLWKIISQSNLLLLFGAFLLMVFSIILSSLKWQIITWSQKTKVNFLQLLKLYYIGLFFNSFLPTTVGGDVVRGYYLAKETGSRLQSGMSILVERFSGGIALLFISIISYYSFRSSLDIKSFDLLFLVLTICLVILISIAIYPLLFKTISTFLIKVLSKLKMHRISEISEKASKSFIVINSNTKLIFSLFFFSIFFHIIANFLAYVVALGLGLNIPPIFFFILNPIISIISMIPISFNGIGIRETSAILLYQQLGVANADILMVYLFVFFFYMLNSLIGGIVYILYNQHRR